MSIKESIDALIEVVQILASWPLVIMYLALIFRSNMIGIFPALGKRVKRISAAGITIDLESSELRELVVFKATDEVIDVPDEDLEEEIVTTVEDDEGQAEEEHDFLLETLRRLRESSQ